MVAKSKAKGGFIELVKTVVYALLLAGVIRTLFFQPFWIPSGSMKPTLLIGDFLFVNKMAYGYSRHSCPFSLCPIPGRILAREPERGDVVVFKHPTNHTDYINNNTEQWRNDITDYQDEGQRAEYLQITFLAVGGVAVAAGTYMFLKGRSKSRSAESTIVQPTASPGGAGVLVRGSF